LIYDWVRFKQQNLTPYVKFRVTTLYFLPDIFTNTIVLFIRFSTSTRTVN